MMKKQWIVALGITLLLVGCGESSTAEEKVVSTKVPTAYSNKVINNRGLVVEGSVDGYGIKIYSNSAEVANPQNIHKGVVVKVNGKSSQVMPIEIAYLGKSIVVALVNDKGEEVAVSDEIKVTDVPVVVVEMNI